MKKATKTNAATAPSRALKPKASEPAPIEEWVARLKPDQQALFAAVRSVVAQQVPGAALLIKWGHPIWDSGGPFVLFKPASNHVTLGFWHGPDLPDPDGLLEGEGGSVRHVKLRRVDDLQKFPIQQWIGSAVALNAEVGDASKRK
ncbi:MAG: DUF1801 domain-containing protein [Acidobacteria bacterium]|nr:DUF1801 domain-containing protein [Acidobacteriota bacterium]